jgi:hypothetical protein
MNLGGGALVSAPLAQLLVLSGFNPGDEIAQFLFETESAVFEALSLRAVELDTLRQQLEPIELLDLIIESVF